MTTSQPGTERDRVEDIAAGVELYLVTGLALITTAGPLGRNVMAAEWTMQVSYEPLLIATFVSPEDATHGQIVESGEFGANVCGADQVRAAAVAGSFSRRDVDKLSSLVFDTYPAKRIRAPMIGGCVVNAECVLRARYVMGDHTAFVGEVVAASFDPSRRPLARHQQGFYPLAERHGRLSFLCATVTPSTAQAGQTVRVAGRAFSRPPRVGISLRDGSAPIEVEAVVEPTGYFTGDLALPATLAPGEYLIAAAAADGQEGLARVMVA